ncbi:MAG TPA: S8 family serine peptidase [Thermomonospora sp.]|nr:S8 family serine peptidase [Thermomonospora sp.]
MTRRRGITGAALVAAGALVLTGTGGPAAAGPPGTGKPAGPGGGKSWQVTLVTGDRVTVASHSGGISAIKVEAGPGREDVRFRTMRLGGRSLVIPSDAAPLVGQGRLDSRLFDVDRLIAWGYDDARRPDIPVIAQRAVPGRGTAVAGSTTTAALPSLDLEAVRVDKRRAGTAWASLTRGVRAGSLAGGVARLWLDGKRRASLDRSVPQVGAPAAWRKGLTGKGMTVAVLDTGYDRGHPDLKGVVTHARGFTPNGASDVQDTDGHGTHVASIVAGSGAASKGRYRGVAPGARIAAGKVFDGDTAQDSWILAGMEWAATRVKARVVNMSLGGDDTQGSDPLEQAIDTLSARTGTLFVVAAGNEGGDPRTISSPASADAALAVGAVDGRDRLTDWSSVGPRLGDNAIKPDLTAPGSEIAAARAKGSGLGDPVGSRYQRLSGTSMATPHVAGAAAILAQRHPGWSAARLKAALIGTTKPAGAGQVFRQGSGRLDVNAAVSQPVVADVGNLSTYLRWPEHRPVTRTITYTNRSGTPVTVKLAVSAARHGGGTAPGSLFRLSASTLRVPARGTAKVRLTVNGKGVATGAYGGVLQATAGKARVRVLVGAYVEPKAHHMQVRMLDRSGRPLSDLVTVSKEDGTYDELVWAQNGVARLRLPAGRYRVHGMLLLDGDDCSPAMLAHRAVDLTSDRQVSIDARQARHARVTLDDPAAQRVPGYEMGYTFQLGRTEYSAMFTDGDCPSETALVLPERRRGLGYYHRAVWRRSGQSPHHYDVYDYRPDGLPEDPTHAARKDDMAVVEVTHRALGTAAQGEALTGAAIPKMSFLSYSSLPGRTPGTLTYHLTADPRLLWFREFSPADQWPNALLAAPARAFTKGVYRETYNAAVMGPGLNVDFPLGLREGDEISYDSWQGLFSDGAGNFGHDANATGTLTLTSGGKVVAKVPYRDRILAARVPAERRPYALTADVTRNVPYARLSTRIKTTWTFSSARAREAALPLQAVRWAPDGLNAHNQAKGGTTTRIPVRVDRAHGAPAADVRKLTLSVSTDDGRTWRPLKVERSGSGWVTSVPNPASGFVSLRATVTDTQGNTADQTVVRAYQVVR